MSDAHAAIPTAIERAVRQCTSFTTVVARTEGARSTVQTTMADAPATGEKPRRSRSRNDKRKTIQVISSQELVHIVALQCLSQVCPDFSFDTWVDDTPGEVKKEGVPRVSRAGWEAVKRLNVDQSVAKLAYYKYFEAAVGYIHSVIRVADTTHLPEMTRLKCVLQAVFNCHRYVASDKVAQEGQMCYVLDAKGKANQPLCVIEMFTHHFTGDCNQPIVPGKHATSFVLCERYISLCCALWYLLNASHLVEHEYLRWRDERMRDADTAQYDAAAIDTVHAFIADRTDFIAEMHREIVARYNVLMAERDLFDKSSAPVAPK